MIPSLRATELIIYANSANDKWDGHIQEINAMLRCSSDWIYSVFTQQYHSADISVGLSLTYTKK